MKITFLFLAVLPLLVLYFFQRDTQTVHTAQKVVADAKRFCKEEGHLPGKQEFIGINPGLAWDSEWFYWLVRNGEEVVIQYPMMSSWHKDAPGTSKTSEFTATTYAYTVSIKCTEDQEVGWPSDPISCPSGAKYRMRYEHAGAYEWCESLSGENSSVKQGPYRSWFNRDLRILMEQGSFSKGQKTGLWVECDRFKECERKSYGPISSHNIEYSSILANPYKALWEGEGETQGLIRFFLDLDGDEKKELFVGAKSLLGKGGGIFSIFKEIDSGYASLGEVFIYPGAFELLPIRHNDFFDLRYCAGISAEQCELITFVFNGKEYMRSNNPEPQSFKELGSYGYVSVMTEESGGTLTWGP